jgi:TonB family protein
MPTPLKALVSRIQFVILALFLGMTHPISAQTVPAAPAPAASSPAAIAAQQGLSESVLRQAQGPYRMILNSPTVVRPKTALPVAPAAPAAARVADPVAVSAPLSAAARKAALADAEAPVTARSATPAPEVIAAPVNVAPAAPALSPVAPAQVATPAVNPVIVPVAIPQPPPQLVVAAVVEKPLIAVRQEEPLLAGPLARERPTGVVQVGFNVNTNGSTGDISVVSSTNRKLNSAVVNAVTKWVYQPLEAVRRVEVAIEFKND